MQRLRVLLLGLALLALPAAADQPAPPGPAALGAQASDRERELYGALRLEIETRSSEQLAQRTTALLALAARGAGSDESLAAARAECRPTGAAQLQCVVRASFASAGPARAALGR